MRILEQALTILGDIGDNKLMLELLDPYIERLVPFVGAGLSANFGYPGWKKLLQGMAGRLNLRQQVDDLLDQNHYEEAAELVQNDRPGVFTDTLCQVFDHKKLPRPLGKGAVRHLPRLAKGPVLTTNFDRVIEAAFEDVGR